MKITECHAHIQVQCKQDCKILQGACDHIPKLENSQANDEVAEASKKAVVESHQWNCIHTNKRLQIMEYSFKVANQYDAPFSTLTN